MLKKNLFNKIYPKLIYLFLILFLLNLNPVAAELGQYGYKRSVEVNEYEDIYGNTKDKKKKTERCKNTKALSCDRSNIKYEDLKVQKKKIRNPFNIFKNKKKKVLKQHKNLIPMIFGKKKILRLAYCFLFLENILM